MTATDPQGCTYDAGLFDVDQDPKLQPTPDKPTRTQAQHRKVARRIAFGVHPLGDPIRLHPDAPRDLDYQEARRSESAGPRCGSCRFRVIAGWPKCHLPALVGGRTTFPRESGSETSDVAACGRHAPNGKAPADGQG